MNTTPAPAERPTPARVAQQFANANQPARRHVLRTYAAAQQAVLDGTATATQVAQRDNARARLVSWGLDMRRVHEFTTKGI